MDNSYELLDKGIYVGVKPNPILLDMYKFLGNGDGGGAAPGFRYILERVVTGDSELIDWLRYKSHAETPSENREYRRLLDYLTKDYTGDDKERLVQWLKKEISARFAPPSPQQQQQDESDKHHIIIPYDLGFKPSAQQQRTEDDEPDLRARITAYNPPWPKCSYHDKSRRALVQRRRHCPASDTLYKELDRMRSWRDLHSISIDGMNGTGKSTLASAMNRKLMKINAHCPYVTRGSVYNRSPLRAMEYLWFHVLGDTSDDAYVVWDRSRYSNLIFAYVHHLMSVYRTRPMPGPHDDEPFLFMNNMALANGLFPTVSYVESVCADRRPILFLVNSDMRRVAEVLRRRGNQNDIYNAKEYNYQMAQYHAYRYFARLLKAPLIDLADVLSKTTYTDFQTLVMERVDREADPQTRDDDDDDRRRTGCYSETARELHEACERYDDLLVYGYSTK